MDDLEPLGCHHFYPLHYCTCSRVGTMGDNSNPIAVLTPNPLDIEADIPGQAMQDHKDSLNRYCCITDPNRDKDHFLNPENGKLELLRVQQVQGSRLPELQAKTPWSRPKSLNALQTAWREIQRTPLAVLAWVYGNKLTAEAVRDGALTLQLPPTATEDAAAGKCSLGSSWRLLFHEANGPLMQS